MIIAIGGKFQGLGVPLLSLRIVMKVNITENIYDLDNMLDELSNREIGLATRSSINTTLRKSRLKFNVLLRRDIALKPTSIKKRLKTTNANGSNLSTMMGTMNFSGEPIRMLELVIGKKSKINQKGISIKNRRKLKVRIVPGKTVRLKGAFIQQVKSKSAFRRTGGKGSRRLRKLSISSLAVIAWRDRRRNILDKMITVRFDKEFNKQIQFRMGKLKRKYSNSSLKIPR
mgnify:CR=1 FL=1